jgi:FkbM family methyltransferase
VVKTIRTLAEFRGESFEQTLIHVVNRVGLQDIPGSFQPHHLPRNWHFNTLAVEGAHHATITLENGRILTGYRSDARFQRFYRCLSDKLPPGVTDETYEVFVESYRRYETVLKAKPFLQPQRGRGGTMVDAGAYIGFKGLAYADYLGPNGKVLMIDIDPISAALALRNIVQNGLQDRVQSFCAAIWSKDYSPPAGTETQQTFDRVRNTLVKIDEHPDWTVGSTVATRSLDSLFREAGLEEIDYLNMQLNGAEFDALDGLVEYFGRVKVIYCAASFHADGKPLNERVAARFSERGCWVKSTDEGVMAVTPAHRSSFALP